MVELASIHLSVGIQTRQRKAVQMDGMIPNSIDKVVQSARCSRLVERVRSILCGCGGHAELSQDTEAAREDCTKVAKIARAANLQSSLPSCNLRMNSRTGCMSG